MFLCYIWISLDRAKNNLKHIFSVSYDTFWSPTNYSLLVLNRYMLSIESPAHHQHSVWALLLGCHMKRNRVG